MFYIIQLLISVTVVGLAAIEGVLAEMAENRPLLRATGSRLLALLSKTAEDAALVARAAYIAALAALPLASGAHWLVVAFAAALSLVCYVAAKKLTRRKLADTDLTAEAMESEILQLIDDNDEAIDEDEKIMINNIFAFDNKSAGDVAVHRKDMVMLSSEASRDEVIGTMIKERYSRVPVYEGTVDNIIGVIHIKDLFRVMPEGGEVDIKGIMKRPIFVPLSKKTDELFREMRAANAHMAVVVDEYGGTAGLVTMEDLIEQIVGSIYDEDDEEEEPLITPVYGGVFAVSGKTPLKMLADEFGAVLPVEEFDTLSGFIVGRLGRIPAAGEKPWVVEDNLVITAFQIEDNRVSTAVVFKSD